MRVSVVGIIVFWAFVSLASLAHARVMSVQLPELQGAITNFHELKNVKIFYSVDAQWDDFWIGSARTTSRSFFDQSISLLKDGSFTLPSVERRLPLRCLFKTCQVLTSVAITFSKPNHGSGVVTHYLTTSYNDDETDFQSELNERIGRLNGFKIRLSMDRTGNALSSVE